MPQISENFELREFDSPDGEPIPSDLRTNVGRLVRQLEVRRAELGAPIRVISGYRSPAYNKRINGAPRSQHMSACAADIKVKGYEPREVHRMIERLIAEGKMDDGGLGLYETFVHYDVRGRRARWYGRGVTP